MKSSCLKQLEKFGNQGMRTLVYSERILSQEDLNKIEKKYLNAIADLKNKNKKLEDLYEEYEVDLMINGVTAIEDCLQDNLRKNNIIYINLIIL
jgi:magnesium-transporting ATPase (P-type)